MNRLSESFLIFKALINYYSVFFGGEPFIENI